MTYCSRCNPPHSTSSRCSISSLPSRVVKRQLSMKIPCQSLLLPLERTSQNSLPVRWHSCGNRRSPKVIWHHCGICWGSSWWASRQSNRVLVCHRPLSRRQLSGRIIRPIQKMVNCKMSMSGSRPHATNRESPLIMTNPLAPDCRNYFFFTRVLLRMWAVT